MRVVVFCGSFDPVHTGHAMMANFVSQTDEADCLWFMPSRINPLKVGHPPVADTHRLEMCRLVASRCSAVQVSDAELSLPAPSYTYDTLCHLRSEYPGHSFRLLVGSDNWLCFDRWRNADKIIAEFGLLIYPRPGYELEAAELPQNVKLLDEAPQALISSTFIRRGLANGENMSFFVPDDVLEYIKTNELYG